MSRRTRENRRSVRGLEWKRYWIVVAVLVLLGRGISPLEAQCKLTTVSDPATDAWSNLVISAILGGDGCYAAPSAFNNSDCNIFVGRVMEQVYSVKDFRAASGANARYLNSNEISINLTSRTVPGWEDIGGLKETGVLQRAQQLANQKTPVLAVFPNPGDKGHVVLIGPGPMKQTGSLGMAPVSASFFQGHPEKNYIAKPLSCGFNDLQIPKVRVYARTGP